MTSGDLRQRNVTAAFAVLDADGSGVLDRTDFEKLSGRVTLALGLDPGGQVATSLRAAYLTWWEQLRADLDTDADGRITRAEFEQAFQGEDPVAYVRQGLGKLIDVLFRALDADGDGYITRQEYANLFAVGRLTPEEIEAGFRQLDADSDGRISRAEFLAAVEIFFSSSDPDAPGVAMLGLR
ncbi:EF-hand domain-containing protein [Rhizohabitans arisaemae]|uniref:EF-hand domain-containing protein n=1 Tax=Rhizohabitans arisaemae TaxID=2720610 RepID=UPI0024B20E9A|nr:EF-hand domain-containing protein [Rhizohabitans arisaemae]